MPDYKETAVTGTQWKRCDSVTISNPYGGTPTIRLGEEDRANVGGAQFSKTAAGITFDFDPAIVIQLRDPFTGDVIPGATMTGAQMYAALYSLYIQKALERDTAAG